MEKRAFAYDQANRLKQVTQSANTDTFAYNGLGDRLSQTVNGTVTRYVNDPAAGLTQVLSDGTSTYLYGVGRIAQQGTSLQYFGSDALGSVRQLYNSSGQILATTRYDPYGTVLSQNGTATSIYGFTGEQLDASTGLEYLRARFYDPAQARFTTRDVWEGDPTAPMSYNAWAYAYGNPTRYTDPSGRCPWCIPAVALALVAVLSSCAAPPAVPPAPTATPGTEFSGYVLLLACGRDTDCASGRYNTHDYPQLPLQPLRKAFTDQAGVARYVPGDFSGSDAQMKALIDQVGSTIEAMIEEEQKNASTKGVFVVGHSLGGNMVVDGMVKYRGSAQNPSFVRGVVLIEPDLVDPKQPDYNSRLDTQAHATELSNDGMLIVGRQEWLAPTGPGPSSMPTPGAKELEIVPTKAETHFRAATSPDMVSRVMEFFLRRR